MELAKEYGRLITKKGKIWNVSRVRMYDNHCYNWHQQLARGGMLYTPTDQTYDLNSSFNSPISFYDEVWFDGVLIYKKSLIGRLLGALKGSQ